MISAPGDPPGSRVTMVRRPAPSRRSASILIWVDLPDPSPPSKVINRPRAELSFAAGLTISELLGAGAEHPDHELAGAVDSTPQRGSGPHRFCRIHRRLHREIRTAPHLYKTDRLARLDRRPHRSMIDDAGDQLVVAVLLHHHLHRL